MATWQFDLHLVPRKTLQQCFEGIPQNISPEYFDKVDWWDLHQPKQNFRNTISLFLSEYKTWNEFLLSWGSEEGNRIDIDIDVNGKIEDVFIRIDVRELSKSFLENIIYLAKEWDCYLLVMETMKLIEPDITILLNQLDHSKANLFVTNPQRFFEVLAKENLIH
jgi:hypothetical protein